MSSEETLVLSVDETNKLRAKLGLAPLRLKTSVIAAHNGDDDHAPAAAAAAAQSSSGAEQQEEERLEMSVQDTNALREKLGLSVLRESSSKTTIVHAPAHNEGERQGAAERIERARLQRQVDQGISRYKNEKSLGEESSSAKSWAAQMRSSQQEQNNSQKSQAQEGGSKKTLTTEHDNNYGETDLHGMNVAHAMSELQDGSTTILTMADESLLKTRDDTSNKAIGLNEDDFALENVNLAEQSKQQQGLRDKRKMELGMGRAGGYAGFDDDEFEDLGGSQAPSRFARGGPADATATKKQRRGFQIGSHLQEDGDDEPDLFAGQKGKAVSLDPSQADVAASDFMTTEEDEATRQQKKKKKDSKFKKKDKKKKDKKKKKRRAAESDDEDDDAEGETKPQRGLLEELEETAVDATTAKKRRRSNDETNVTDPSNGTAEPMDVEEDKQEEAKKRARFDAIMAKGNERTREAFQTKDKPVDLDEEPDDAFLNAALAKARRLNRLREMSKSKNAPRGADAVVEAVQSSRAKQEEQTPSGTIAFAVDETREFTRALLARAEQTEREQARKAIKKEKDTGADESDMDIAENPVPVKEEPEAEIDMAELAKEVEEEDVPDAGGSAGAYGSVVPMGRGLAGVLGMLKQTGEITGKNAGKEEMRGRAKDKRTYEDYESLDLSKVVKIDQRTATDKDKDFASREIKLEYRDKFGRLLTRKEAFRDLSYQFHGHGSGKRKEEKRLQQVAREQAEGRLASRQVAEGASAGMLGALKATQQATGKAFVVHKSGT
jgi:U4/U6.U5 tri-snRNP-associated protein 1